jgi:glycosyltransferase involved in cell wall biosynthesis
LTYQANFDAVNFFLREVFPHIVRSRPGVRLYVTGRLDGVAVERLPQYPNVVFTGYLPNVRPRVAQSWLCVVQLRVGGGTRLKVLEALALGTPVVSTLKGVEGLDLQPGRDLLVADGPAEFASGVLRVLSDRILREQLSVNGRRASIQYDWSDVGRRLTNMICSMSTPRSETQTAGWQ